MSADTLAIFGGAPVLSRPLAMYQSVGELELDRVLTVLKTGCLSAFYGSHGDQFLGGPMVREFEKAWGDRFGSRHVVSVNSATSGLFAAIGAAGVGPGDEVIVPPYTMSASVMAPLIYGGIPVFVDIEPDTFCLDPALVKKAITPRTKAIMAVSLFGHPARLRELRAIADEHGVILIEDAAQALTATEDGRHAGTFGHIGVFSLNYHKHIHTGEGGMCVTDDDTLAVRLQLIRNHAENIVEPMQLTDLTNMVGFNFRMTELSAAVGIPQLANMDRHVGRRQAIAAALSEAVAGLEGITAPVVRAGCRHAFYVWAARVDEAALGVTRAQFSAALAAEGFPHFTGYVRPLYLLPVFQRRIAIGGQGYPFTLSDVRYDKGLCPVAERMHEHELLCYETCQYDVTPEELALMRTAIRKVHAQRDRLRALPRDS